MKSQNSNMPRRKATAVFTVFGIITAFLILLSIPFGHGVGTLLVILLAIITLGVLKKKRPELFSALKKGKTSEISEHFTSKGPIHSESHRTYAMLIGLNTSEAYRIIINKSPFVIGNSADADFQVADAYVSGKHMIIEYDASSKQRFVTDTSRNGTMLNGTRLNKGEKHPISHGDTLMVGGTAFTVEYVYF